MKQSEFPDPFEQARREKGFGEMDDQNDPVNMILRHEDVRKCAMNWETFQSGAKPGRIVVPSEVDIRDTRQIPFEVDPPLHKEYRSLVEQWFRRPVGEEYQKRLREIIRQSFDELEGKKSVEVIYDFSLPIQSRALTLLLNSPYEEAERWISWGTHVFRSEDDPLDSSKANLLYDYLNEAIAKAEANPSDDMYSLLLAAEFQGRKLTKEEIKGVMILTFAGGRDTVINAITNTIAYFADHPEALMRIQEEPKIKRWAVEELIRYFAPLTHMGRVATEKTELCEHAIEADSRISLCWASANRDEGIFENPNEVILDRKKNPHLSFGYSHHRCLGATHARQLMLALLDVLVERVSAIEILGQKDNIEDWGEFKRKVGFHELKVHFHPK
ncbi:MAG: cytochrome P450 [Bacteroidota bacterium]